MKNIGGSMRSIYQPQEMAAAGFTDHSIGRPVAAPLTEQAPHLRAIR